MSHCQPTLSAERRIDQSSGAVDGPGRRVLLTTTSSDSHTWNLVFLQLLLQENGHQVTNLGPCVPDALLIRSAAEQQPDAIVISTVNGHGAIDGERTIRVLRKDPATRDIPVMIGGQLGIAGLNGQGEAQRLQDAGFDAVFAAGSNPAELPLALSRVLGQRSGCRAG